MAADRRAFQHEPGCRASTLLQGSQGARGNESRGAAAAHALRSVAQGIVFLLNSTALSCVGLAAVWLAVYMVFRFARNSQMQNLQYFRIWVVALVLAFPLSIALDAWN